MELVKAYKQALLDVCFDLYTETYKPVTVVVPFQTSRKRYCSNFIKDIISLQDIDSFDKVVDSNSNLLFFDTFHRIKFIHLAQSLFCHVEKFYVVQPRLSVLCELKEHKGKSYTSFIDLLNFLWNISKLKPLWLCTEEFLLEEYEGRFIKYLQVEKIPFFCVELGKPRYPSDFISSFLKCRSIVDKLDEYFFEWSDSKLLEISFSPDCKRYILHSTDLLPILDDTEDNKPTYVDLTCYEPNFCINLPMKHFYTQTYLEMLIAESHLPVDVTFSVDSCNVYMTLCV
jgi:hypothetical protein